MGSIITSVVFLFFVIVTRLFGGRNLFKPQAPKEQTQVYRCGGVELDDSRHAVTVDGVRYGKPPLPPRRDGQPIPPIPGVNNAPERPTSARAGRQARVVATDRAGARHGSGNGLGGGV